MPSAPAGRASAAWLLRAVALAAAALPLAVTAPALAQGGAGTTVVGQLVQAYPESAREDGPLAAAPLSWVRPTSGRAVRVDTGDVGGIAPGSTVRVTVGGPVQDAASGDGYGAARAVTDADVLAAPTGTTDGDTTSGDGGSQDGEAAVDLSGAGADLTDQVAVVLVVPQGGHPDSTSLQGLVDTVDGPVHDFWASQSNGAIRLGVTVAQDWVTTAAGCDDPTDLWAQAAEAAGFTPGPGRHLLVYISGAATDAAACSYGLAEVGAGLRSGGALYVRDTLPSLIAHELGHNFGLGHSSERQCDGAVDTGTCRTVGYRDYYDVMGASWKQVGTLNVAQEARLGVLPAAQRRTVAATGDGGSLTLAPLSGRAGVRGLELTATDGTAYWLEYRTASGQDAWLGTGADWIGLEAGVLLHRSAGLPDTSLLLDGTPSSRARWDADLDVPLPVGTPVRLADGFTVTVTAQSARGADITVTTATPAGTATAGAAPSSATPSSATPSSAMPSSAVPSSAVPSSTVPSSATTGVLPGGACTAGCAQPQAGTPDPVPGTQPAPRLGAPAPVTAAQAAKPAGPMEPAALRSSTVLGAVAALGCGVLLLGWVVVSRVRRRAR